jgi:serine/threonine protein kinase
VTDIATPTSGPAPDPLAGTAYRTIRRIGSGAMGQVFEAEHTGLRRRVAVKLLSPLLAGDPVFVDRLRLEAQALATVRHPNVVAVNDHATTPAGVPFLAMELLQGRTLHDLLRERRALPFPEALQIFDQLLGGLGAIHAAGLVHRDLKPANVFLCREGGRTTVKVLDFGIVKVARHDLAGPIAPARLLTQQGHAIGTPNFMAPEQVLGQGCDARTDIYAAGVLLYLLLSGRAPFQHHRTEVGLLAAQVTECPPALSSVAAGPFPPGLEAAIARALAKDPADRFASVEEFGRALSEPHDDARRRLRALANVTEKMPGGTWNAARGTAPLDASVFRPARKALPFVAATPQKPASTAPTVYAAAVDPLPAADVTPTPNAGSGGSPTPTPMPTPTPARTPAPRSAPSFGLPPAPKVPAAPAPATPTGLSLASALQGNRLLFGAVVAVWCVLAVMLWRVL